MKRATQQKLSKLRALVEHPSTPFEERENAKVRIQEILSKIQTESDNRRYSHLEPSARTMAERISRKGIDAFKEKIRAIVPDETTVHDGWPFGWRGRKEKIPDGEYEFSYGHDRMCFAWECPDCGSRVERNETAQKARQVTVSKDSIKRYIARMRRADRNQLCPACWRKWNDR